MCSEPVCFDIAFYHHWCNLPRHHLNVLTSGMRQELLAFTLNPELKDVVVNGRILVVTERRSL